MTKKPDLEQVLNAVNLAKNLDDGEKIEIKNDDGWFTEPEQTIKRDGDEIHVYKGYDGIFSTPEYTIKKDGDGLEVHEGYAGWFSTPVLKVEKK